MDSNHYCLSAPAKEIRLLDLLPATTSRTLTARIRRFPLDDMLPYISVSHVWGDEKATSLMRIESGCGDKDIRISRHIESLLIGLLCHTADTLPEIWNNGSRLPISEEAAGNPIRYDLELEEAYKTFVVTHTELHQNLDFLGLCTPIQRDTVRVNTPGRQQRRRFSAPSRVPNWDSRNLRRCLGLSHIAYDEKYFDASGKLPLDYLFNANELVVLGVMVDRIQLLGNFVAPERHTEFSNPSSKIFQQYFDFYVKRPIEETLYPDELSLAKASACTISLYGVYLSPVPSPDELPERFYHWCQGSTLGNQLEERGFKYQISQRDALKGFMRMKHLPSRQPFITEKGYIGLAREKCGIGDQLWIVGGCSVPIMLSPLANDAHNHEVRGEVLIDGLMFRKITKNPDNLLAIEKVPLAQRPEGKLD
ncbi:hypothetical protein F4782DRAFT_551208 [Xylaria castorea]|nr:hypothetical protein F4782DRAFT_551208 [Xylaria castorea]